jgi:hypothetical protein
LGNLFATGVVAGGDGHFDGSTALILRPLEALPMAGAGWTAQATVPVPGAICDQQFKQVRQQLTQTRAQTRAEAAVDQEQRAAGATAAREPNDPLANEVLALDVDRAPVEQAPGFCEGAYPGPEAYPDPADADWRRSVSARYEDVLHLKGKSSKAKPD